MTPLDVIKTRLQTQSVGGLEILRSTSREAQRLVKLDQVRPHCPAHVYSLNRMPKEAFQPSAWSRSTANAAMPLVVDGYAICVYPERCHAARACSADVLLREGRMSGIWDGIVKIVRFEGWRALWRGLLPTVYVDNAKRLADTGP